MRIEKFEINEDGLIVNFRTGEIVDTIPPNGRLRVCHPSGGESMTHQSFASQCDVNNIIRNYEATGVFPPDLGNGVYDDVSGLNQDLTTLINQSTAVMQTAKDEYLARQKKADETSKIGDVSGGVGTSTTGTETPPK